MQSFSILNYNLRFCWRTEYNNKNDDDETQCTHKRRCFAVFAAHQCGVAEDKKNIEINK